jgi:hypothetical protein
MELPSFACVRQRFDGQPEADDVAAAVRAAILGSKLRERLQPGARVAITAGSRGIAAIDTILRAAVDTVRKLGFSPSLVAAMGSHGGGTAEGQRLLLAELGITRDSMGCPIQTEMETVALGTNRFGLPIVFDRNAMEADGIVLLNRIKPHTSFTGRYESGLLKMLVVGLGKREGAAQVHKLGLHGLKELIPEVGSVLLAITPVALGVAILENARERTALIEAIEPEDLLDREPVLLEQARGLMGRLPFDQLDVLIVGELGKNYSGTGLDPNVIGRQRVETMPDLPRPIVTRLAVLDVSPESRGNALGVGLADMTTRRLVEQIDPLPIRVNSLTSNVLSRARIPLALATDREVIDACFRTCWRIDPSEARGVIIANTLELESFWITPALEAECASNPHLARKSEFHPLPIDERGTLAQEWLFPRSLRGRRRPEAAGLHS